MRPAAIGVIVAILLVVFVAIWVYLASQGIIPSVGGQLQGVGWLARLGALIGIVVVIGLLFARTKKHSA